jgi:aspartokinase
MITVSQIVEDIFTHDDVALAAARNGWLNLSSYARSVRPLIQKRLLKDVQTSSIVTALTRITTKLEPDTSLPDHVVQSLSLHSDLEVVTYERTEKVSSTIRDIYSKIATDNKSYLTITQGINEVTIISDSDTSKLFKHSLQSAHRIYEKPEAVGITVKFTVGNVETPNLIFHLTHRLAYRDINIVEIVSTATELTYVIEKKNLTEALEQLQKTI